MAGQPYRVRHRYRGATPGDRLWRGLARLLADDVDTLAFFDALISLDNGK